MIVYCFYVCINEKSPTRYDWSNEILSREISTDKELLGALANAHGKVLEYRLPINDEGLKFIYFFHTDYHVISWFRNGMSAMWRLCDDKATRPKFDDKIDLPTSTFYDDFIKGINNG